MKIGIVIPIYNEEQNLEKTLQSLCNQSVLPFEMVLVDDNSTDQSYQIIEKYQSQYPFIKSVRLKTKNARIPGAKVVKAFLEGLKILSQEVDVICKFDADLIFPDNYLEKMERAFQKNQKLGMFSGICVVEKDGRWKKENLAEKKHTRGALKSYTRQCYQSIGGVRQAMGWDTLDELLAQYNKWEVYVDENLEVKHLRETASQYSMEALHLQGESFYRVGYGAVLALLSSAKLAYKKKKMSLFGEYWQGYLNAYHKKVPYLVTKQEAKWIRKYRWRRILRKMFFIE